jgi:hypothetical protein
MKVVKSRVAGGVAGLLLLAGCAGPPAGSAPASAPASGTPPRSGAPAASSATTPRPCLSSRNHFAGNADTADTTLPIVCLDVGGVVDLDPLAAGHRPWTGVSSSDDAVLTCSLDNAHATCRAVAPGHALATATGPAEAWRVQVFVGDPAR